METLRVTRKDSKSATKCLKSEEDDLLSTVKKHIEEYLRTNRLKASVNEDVLTHIENVKANDALLLKYLQGRKNDPLIAWDTIRSYAEYKFQHYPETFPGDVMPVIVLQLLKNHVIGRLKNRDKLGRRILFLNTTLWDPNVYSIDDLTMAALYGAERNWSEPDVLNNGVILVENTQGFGLAHARQHTMHKLHKIRNIFLHSFPMSMKAIFYLNMPLVFTLVLKMSKALIPKKIKSRMFFYSGNDEPVDLFKVAPPEILPHWMGGTLAIEEAAEDISCFTS